MKAKEMQRCLPYNNRTKHQNKSNKTETLPSKATPRPQAHQTHDFPSLNNVQHGLK